MESLKHGIVFQTSVSREDDYKHQILWKLKCEKLFFSLLTTNLFDKNKKYALKNVIKIVQKKSPKHLIKVELK